MIRVVTQLCVGGAIGRIILDRPEKKNALTPEMIAGMVRGLRELGGQGRGEEERHSGGTPVARVGAIVMEGEGAAFCAGFDLTLCRENSDAMDALLTGLSGVIRVMRRAEVPIVVAAHGAAIAGGCALLGGADVVITHHDAKIGYPVVRLGISPAVSASTFRLAVGDGKARERMLDTALMSGWDACRAGLAHECLEDAGKVRARAVAVAEQLAAKPRHGMVATKRWLGEVDGSFGPDSARALDASLALVGSAEERERLAALWKA